MANEIVKEIADNTKWLQLYIVFDGTNATNTSIIDASTLEDADGTKTLHDLTFKNARWCISGTSSNPSVEFKFKDVDSDTSGPDTDTPITFLKIGKGSGKLELDIANTAGDKMGDIIYTSANNTIGFVIMTFEKVSGFTDIDAAYHSTEYPSMPSLP